MPPAATAAGYPETTEEPACRQIALPTYPAFALRPSAIFILLGLSLGAAAIAAPTLSPATPAKSPNAPTSASAQPQQPQHETKAPKRHVAAKIAKPDPSAHYIDVAGFGAVAVYAPKDRPRAIALFASGDGGWNLGVREMASTAASLGYWVAGFDTPALLKTMSASNAACIDMAGALANLGDKVKSSLKLPADWRPVLIGYSSGATIDYAALSQAGDRRFSAALSLGFCPDLLVHKPFCPGAGLSAHKPGGKNPGIVFDTVPEVPAPWIVLQGDIDKVCNPPATIEFVHKVKNASVVELPHVGHGYGVPKNWMPQYRRALMQLRDAGSPAATSVPSSNSP